MLLVEVGEAKTKECWRSVAKDSRVGTVCPKFGQEGLVEILGDASHSTFWNSGDSKRVAQGWPDHCVKTLPEDLKVTLKYGNGPGI